ncbi:hypothetical protein SLG_01550 [Sphingobium sp. SYK-6]|uniref:hypothetical protein n=1 Tax=Sphingobium sp. (strain NBRC 103272 / SYK-6) TaxID=627192 RepID=UPI0002276B31|nr:hypothetical protein [Sphingobium sp. SYK-6]BAK64830.1 hypothetical protein SLG_01550 [Sphingobium sp. SYK-6]
MFLPIALALAQLAQPAQHDPEIEALLRRRDERRRSEALEQPAPRNGADAETGDKAGLDRVLPPQIAERLAACLAKADGDPDTGLADAAAWAKAGGGAYAAHCEGYALGQAGRWTEAADAFARGAGTSGLDVETRARLWSQAGNAALVAGDVPRAIRDLDTALANPLPRTLSTGEIHLDRARARVAAGDLPGARADLDEAVVLAASDPLAWLLSATLARRMDDLPLARLHIGEAAKRAGNDAAVALEQGIILALSGERDDAARAAFSRARELARPDSAIGKQAADYLAQLGAEPEAPKESPVEPGR